MCGNDDECVFHMEVSVADMARCYADALPACEARGGRLWALPES